MRVEHCERISLQASLPPLVNISCFEYVFDTSGGLFDHLYVGTTSGDILYFPTQMNSTNSTSYTVQSPLHLIPKLDGEGNTNTTNNGHEAEVTCLLIASNKRLMFSGSLDRTIKVWDISHSLGASPLLQTMIGHSGAITSILYECVDDAMSLFTFATDGALKMWQPQKGRAIMRNPFFQSICSLSANSNTIAASVYDNMHLWYILKQQQQQHFNPCRNHISINYFISTTFLYKNSVLKHVFLK
jgi:WD40 repeat protein